MNIQGDVTYEYNSTDIHLRVGAAECHIRIYASPDQEKDDAAVKKLCDWIQRVCSDQARRAGRPDQPIEDELPGCDRPGGELDKTRRTKVSKSRKKSGIDLTNGPGNAGRPGPSAGPGGSGK